MVEYTQNPDELRAEVRAWLAEHWHNQVADAAQWEANDSLIAWREELYETGFVAPTFPVEHGGRGYSHELANIIEQEFRAAGVPGSNEDKKSIPGNTILRFGNDKIKQDLLKDALTGRAFFCLFYSEPGAGSDLAGVRTSAVLQGDKWVFNGQKVWTSGAMYATYALCLARSDWDAPKHKGLSYFVIPMKQPGIEVRPLHQITHESHFNEVFITDAETPADYLLGEPGEGWKIIQTALAYERSLMGEDRKAVRHPGVDINDLVGLAKRHGKLDDPFIRRDLADILALRELNALNNARAKASLEPGTSSSIMSLGKLAMSAILHGEGKVRTSILGGESIFAGDEHAEADDVNYEMFSAFVTSIGGGSNQIQRNIVGERVLGLPKEPEADRNLPFREVKGN